MRVPDGATHLRVTVGAAGSATPGAAVSAGTGGNASSIAAVDSAGNVISLLVMAGGGGGAGTCVNFRRVSCHTQPHVCAQQQSRAFRCVYKDDLRKSCGGSSLLESADLRPRLRAVYSSR